MTERLQIYRCDICGNIVEVLHSGGGQLVCCGQPMRLLEEQEEEKGREKHLPVIERIGETAKVKVGSVPHPMEENHYIEWIAVTTYDGVLRKFLKPGEKPEAEFKAEEVIQAKEYCTIHGLWSTRRM